jgi:hypothetical protein
MMDGVHVAPKLKYRLHHLAVPRVGLADAETTVDAPVAALDLLDPAVARGDSSACLGVVAQRSICVLGIILRQRWHEEAGHE